MSSPLWKYDIFQIMLINLYIIDEIAKFETQDISDYRLYRL